MAMKSPFLLKSILFCMLNINVTLCRSSISSAICNARCYWSHSGFDYGYYDTANGQCKCAPPTVYVFDGIGRDFSDDYIEKSLNDKKIVQNPVIRYQNRYEEKSSPSTTVNVEDSNMKTWKQIVETITKKYAFVEETDLESLKSCVADDARAMKYVLLYLQRGPLENALEDVKKVKPGAAGACDELSRLLLLRRRRNSELDEENSKKSIAPKPQQQQPKPAAAAVRAKSIAVKAKGPQKNGKPVPGNGPKTKAAKDHPVKISVDKKKPNKTDAKKPAVAAATAAEKKEREVNGSGSDSGSWTYEEYD